MATLLFAQAYMLTFCLQRFYITLEGYTMLMFIYHILYLNPRRNNTIKQTNFFSDRIDRLDLVPRHGPSGLFICPQSKSA